MLFAGVVIIFRNFGLLIKCENKIILVLCLFTIIGDMNRVLSFPQSHSCDNPSEVVSKRFCFSCIFSVSFVSLILGYMLGSNSKHTNSHVGMQNGSQCTFESSRFNFENNNAKYIGILSSIQPLEQNFTSSTKRVTGTNYDEALLLQRHFEAHKFDDISPIIASNVFLSFKNKDRPDALEIVMDKGEIRYRNVRNTTYNYVIPDDAKVITNVINSVSGLPVYGNYGSQDDFNFLMQKGVLLRGCIVLLRLGKIPILEKVTTALKRGANGVLLFADPQQYPNVDMLSVSEEIISPTLLADLQKMYSSLEIQRNQPNAGVPVQVIEAMTAQNILREMSSINKPPDSWRGSLNALYSIGPGFVESWKLVLYSYFINVNYTTYDIAAYLKGSHEHDRYVIVGNKRNTLNSGEKTSESVNALMEISKTLAELRSKEGWNPSRTIVFCSFGLAEAQSYSEESLIQTYKHIIEQRVIAYLDVKQPTQGLEYLSVKASPLLQNLFENISSMVENPNAEQKLTEKSLLDVWQQQKKQLEDGGNQNATESKSNYRNGPFGNELFASFDIPTISFGYDNQDSKYSSIWSKDSIVNIYEYESAIIQLWTMLIFSLANDLILPFNVSVYPSILTNFHEHFYEENEKRIQNSSAVDDFKRFGEAVKNLPSRIEKFQNDLQTFNHNTNKLLEFRMLNDKLMQIDRLVKCHEENDKFSISSKYQNPVFFSLQDAFSEAELDKDNVKLSLKKATNCINEIHFLIDDIKS